MKVFKIELMIVDHDRCGAEEIKEVIENANYPNRCIAPHIVNMEERDVEWSDEHPLNQLSTSRAAFEELFAGAAPKPE